MFDSLIIVILINFLMLFMSEHMFSLSIETRSVLRSTNSKKNLI